VRCVREIKPVKDIKANSCLDELRKDEKMKGKL
jgi:hypothetical protein